MVKLENIILVLIVKFMIPHQANFTNLVIGIISYASTLLNDFEQGYIAVICSHAFDDLL